jgi:mannose-6-phosphate isomerase-like protein (cupin superfamily)
LTHALLAGRGVVPQEGDEPVKETRLPALPDAKSPAGADIRFIMDGTTGNMIHSTVPPGQINRATVHATVSEFWFVLDGQGEIWRKDATEERVTPLLPGVSIDIPVGTAFQYRNVGKTPLTFICISMPPWPGDREATHLAGAWQPTI